MADKNKKSEPETDEVSLRIYGTNPVAPEEGRVFVWTPTGWFERVEGTSGNVAFTPVAESEDEVREIIERDDPAADLIVMEPSFSQMVVDEFSEQYMDYRDTPLYSEEENVDEDEAQEYHQHEH